MKPVPLNKMRRDGVFKALHQQLAPSNFYALDGDLILVEKVPPSTVYVVAHLEFKMNTEAISFTQAICFNQMVSAPLPWRIPSTSSAHASHSKCPQQTQSISLTTTANTRWKTTDSI
jgi:hypothetical protein